MSSQEPPSHEPTTEPIPTTSSLPLNETTIPQTTSSMPHDSPLSGGDTPRSDEGSKKLNELTELCTKLFDKVISLEKDLKQTKKVYGKALTKLVKKVKHLEDKLKSTTERRKARMVISDEEEDLVSEDPSEQGRMTETEYEDVETQDGGFEYELDQTDILQQITPTKVPQSEEQSQDTSEVQLDVLSAAKILAEASRERVKTYDRRRRSTDSSTVSTAGGLFSTAEKILCTDERLAQKLNEEEKAKAAARKEQERIDFERALEESDTIKRYQTLKKKPVSVAQARKNMMIYLKNMAGYKMNYFKGMSYEDIRPMFKEEYRKLQNLFKKDTEVEKTKTKRVAEETLLQESFKKLRTAEASSSEPIQEQPTEEPKELSEEELKQMLEIVPVGETKAEALQVKYPIIDWEIHTEGLRKYWKIIRVRNITEAYQGFEDLLKGFDREDLDTLWSLKLQRYMHDPLTWRLYSSCGVHHVSSTRGHDTYMLTEKDYPLTTAVMGLMLSRRLQVEEDSEMARDLITKALEETDDEDVEEEYAEVEYDMEQIEQQTTPTKDPQDASREKVKTYNKRRRSTDSSKDSTAGGLFNTAEEIQGKEQISTDEEIAKKLN
ncbi:hypothetical protein Tco_0822339 [Tanacetum coccineum]|uniref:Uncharacterized protein n=1 Tax=Tanacetum coccineum TaxID=301880 RepID=A0ABQ5AEV8_9ASTR